MNCDHEMISAYLDGELDAALLDSVTSHLLDCAECCRQFNDLARARDAIQTNCLVPDPEGIVASVMAAIDRSPKPAQTLDSGYPGPANNWKVKNGLLHK
ncbi:MAG: sigma-E factor negative regulatory protein [Magnetococcales bacterium]|nr:sigma-E factor negative regulatory protein [Magnetococcales bacterium]